ncbi:hypothetical protein [Nitrosomonas sp. Nm58]|uniref:hypothetical protein n=1 Tax=Nitrosomonas sp. Nm58 TaxID=200126 RepID=UPI000897D070|nr:hypothetical protein [Nitrosomonas sp. Nm58]SDY75214.1 hypothetical protein SAMN05421754_102031 [Nitrosomonas sp. Nm58]
MDTIAIFCAIDDFCQEFESWWEQRLLESSLKPRQRRGELCLSEVMAIVVGFHLPGCRTKDYYLNQVLRNERSYFPGLASYNRFEEVISRTK